MKIDVFRVIIIIMIIDEDEVKHVFIVVNIKYFSAYVPFDYYFPSFSSRGINIETAYVS